MRRCGHRHGAVPASALVQLALFFACIAGVYLILRFGDLIRPAGWVAINLVAIGGAVMLARRWQRTGHRPAQVSQFAANLPVPLKLVPAAALVVGLLFPVLLTVYFVRLGAQLWR